MYLLPLTHSMAQAALSSKSTTSALSLQQVRLLAHGVAQAAVSSKGTVSAHLVQSLCALWHAAWLAAVVGAAAVSAPSCAGQPLPPGLQLSCAVLWSPAAALIHPARSPSKTHAPWAVR